MPDLPAAVAHEMRHRLKNQLAVVSAVAKLLARHCAGPGDLALKLEDRLFALAHAQDVLTLQPNRPVAARAAIDRLLKASGAGDQVEVSAMPAAGLSDPSIQSLALILGELCNNALKHGALRESTGHVALSGRAEGDLLALRWCETCTGPVEAEPAGHGGFQLIRRLGAAGSMRPEIDWHTHGIIVTFYLRTAS